MFPLLPLTQTSKRQIITKRNHLCLYIISCAYISPCASVKGSSTYRRNKPRAPVPSSSTFLTRSAYSTRAKHLYFQAPCLQHNWWQFYTEYWSLHLRDQKHVKKKKSFVFNEKEGTLPWKKKPNTIRNTKRFWRIVSTFTSNSHIKPSFVPYPIKLQKVTCRNPQTWS